MRFFALASLLLLFVLPSLAVPARAADEWVVRESSSDVRETVQRLEEAIRRSGSSVLAVFDHSSSAGEVGLSVPPATVVLFAKPKTSSPLIRENIRAAIDMPQRILVWEEDGSTYAGFVAPAALASRYGFAQGHPELARLRAALHSLVGAATKRQDERAEAGH